MSALTYNDVLSAYAGYPAPIRPYLLRAETHPALRSMLTKSFLRVFIDILGRAPIADPARALWLRVDIIAQDLAISTKTVTRAVNFMRKNGWLKRAPGHDGRNRNGEFCAGEFILGEDLRALLGLPTASTVKFAQAASAAQGASDACMHPALQGLDAIRTMDGCRAPIAPDAAPNILTQTMDHAINETEMSDGVYIGVNKVFKKEASFLKTEDSSTNEKDAFISKGEKTKSGEFKVSIDLKPMQAELGINNNGMGTLVKICRDTKQRLQDVWLAKGDYLRDNKMREGRAFNCLVKILLCGEDFSFLARQKSLGKASKNAPAPMRHRPAKVNVDNRIYWNKKFCGANSLRVRIHGDGSAEISDSTRTDAYVRPFDMEPIFEAIGLGKLWLLDE